MFIARAYPEVEVEAEAGSVFITYIESAIYLAVDDDSYADIALIFHLLCCD